MLRNIKNAIPRSCYASSSLPALLHFVTFNSQPIANRPLMISPRKADATKRIRPRTFIGLAIKKRLQFSNNSNAYELAPRLNNTPE